MTSPTKTYLTKSVDEAIAQAREELGSEAMLLNTRKLAGEQGVPGGYEVVFALPEPAVPELDVKPRLLDPPAVPENLAADLERLHSQMDEIRNLLIQSARVPLNAAETASELTGIYDCLIASEVDPALSKDIVDRLGASRAVEEHLQRAAAHRERGGGSPSPSDLDAFEALVFAELERRVGIEPSLGQDDESVVLVGPPGAGKSSAAAKLASFAANSIGTRQVRVVSLGAVNPRLQEIAERLEIAFTNVPSVDLLPSLIAETQKTELLFIDMPGYTANERKEAKAAAVALAGVPGVDIHLVVPGYMKPIDLRRCIQRHEIFRPTKLVVTKMDETHSFGSVFSEAARAGLSLSFLTQGPMIPGDIRAASQQDLLTLALESDLAQAANVA